MVLRRAQIGSPFISRQISFAFGSEIAAPSTDEHGLLLTNVLNTDYWLPKPYFTTNLTDISQGFYWSPNAQQVFAIQSGPITVTWIKSAGYSLAALPAYGGDLFNPDRFPFLEGRPAGSGWRNTPAQPCPIHNRTVLHLLSALQFLEMKVPGGGRESRRLSFRELDIEQIGHVYEGLLDHTARRATEIVLGLDGKERIEVPLSELKRHRASENFFDWLADETGRSAKAIEKALAQTTVDDPLRWPEWEQVAPFAGLVRRDDNGDPCVVPAGSLYAMAAEIVFMSITSSRSRQAPFHFGFFPEDRPPRKGLGRSLLTAAVAEPNVLPCRETAGRMNLNAHRDSLPNCGTKHLLADQPIATGWVEPTVNEIIARPGLCPLVLVPIMGAPGPSHLGTWDVYAGCPRSRGPQRQVLVAGVRIRF